MVNIRDVARQAGVAPITVSRVINQPESVTPATRERVLRVIADLNYVPNTLAKSLRSRQSHTLALMLSDITNPFWTTVARGVEDAASKHGYHVILCNTDEDPVKEAASLTLLLQRRVDGIIIAPTTNEHQRLAALKRQQTACVLIDRRVDGFKADTVYGDSAEAARQLVDHLIGLGHRRIALINGPAAISSARDREAGYRAALKMRRVPVDESLILSGEFKQSSGHQLAQRLLARQPRPTAIFAANNFIAVGVLQVLHAAGLRLPDDMSLVCVDDVPYASVVDPFLTVAAQPAYDMGATAARLLIERLVAGRNLRPRTVVLPPELIIRRSSGPPADQSGA